jgi:cell division transport system permease protein
LYTIREAFAAFARTPLLTLLSAMMVALALFVVGLFTVVAYNLHGALERIEERVEVVAYLRDDTREAEILEVEARLLAMQEVSSVRYLSKAEALRIAQEDIPEFEELFAGVETNPLPASLEIALHPGFRTPESVALVADAAAESSAVEAVLFGQDWVARIHLLRRVGAVGTFILGTAFALVASLIIATAVRIAIFARRDEIQIMRLVGATNGFIRRPFLLEGFLTGLTGGILAVGMTYCVYLAGGRWVLPIDWIPAQWTALGVVAGGIFGTFASAFAIRRYLREI